MFVLRDPDHNCVVGETLEGAFAEMQDTYGAHPIDTYDVWETKTSEPGGITVSIKMTPRKCK